MNNKDFKMYLFMGIVTIVFCMVSYIGGYLDGRIVENVRWTNWCLTNGYAEYDKKTGEIVLFDEKYRTQLFEQYLPKALLDKLDIKLESSNGEII